MNMFVYALLIGCVCLSTSQASAVKDATNEAGNIPSNSETNKNKAPDSAVARDIASGILDITDNNDVVDLAVAHELKVNDNIGIKPVATNDNVSDKKGCNVKNATCVPTREELIASGVENVDMLQHKVNYPIAPELKLNENIEKMPASANENVPDKKGCNVKNSTCVPTREELIASGVKNVDMLQHKVSGPIAPELKLNENIEKMPAAANDNVPDKKGCNVKNSTCVPTREELIASGVENVDMLQHKVSGPIAPELKLNENIEKMPAAANDNVPDKKGCNVKNSTCVPTREELLASGVENVDMLQHKVSGHIAPELKLNENIEKMPAAVNENVPDKKGCNVKNSTCVPTREELIASGVENVDMLQHKVSGPIASELKLNENIEKMPADTKENSLDKQNGCNVKNATCVPTKDELIASGIQNFDMIQHRVSDPVPSELKLNEPLTDNVVDTALSNEERKNGCNVKNSTCVPTESELIAAGVNTKEFVGQFGLDSENIFLGRLKKTKENVPSANMVGSTDNTKDKHVSDNKFTSSLTGDAGTVIVPSSGTAVDELTNEMKPATVQQIPPPGPTTQHTSMTSENGAPKVEPTANTSDMKLEPPKKQMAEESQRAETTQRQSSSAPVGEQTTPSKQTTSMGTVFQTCPSIKCVGSCRYGRKVNSNGCETCECKFSDDCPKVIPSSRLLCLLQVRTSQSCVSNADCRRNRICCPGTCGPTCRRPSRNRSMLLSMFID